MKGISSCLWMLAEFHDFEDEALNNGGFLEDIYATVTYYALVVMTWSNLSLQVGVGLSLKVIVGTSSLLTLISGSGFWVLT